ncbi:MAG: hypothetical protein V1862_01715 [Methanobacteriota archaeon]
MAEEAPNSVVYIQGGKSIITDGADEMSKISIQDVVPFVHVAEGEKSRLFPAMLLSQLTYPLNAVIVCTSSDNESTSIVMISNLSLSDGNKVLTLDVNLLHYYEGGMLKNLATDSIPLTQKENIQKIGVYVEAKEIPPVNADCPSGCAWNGFYCGDFRGWICTPNGPCTTDCGS